MVTIYTIAYNEELILPFFIKWYRKRFPNCKIVVYDNYSTDKTEQIALEFECEVIKYNSGNQIRDDLYLEIKNNCWKTALTDWVLICDADEFLDIDEKELLKEAKKGTSIISFKGYNMYNIEGGISIENAIYGIRAKQYDKSYIFNKNKIIDINYDAGCHVAKPKGKIKYSDDFYLVYHFLYIGEDYLVEKYKRNFERLSEINKKNMWGFHYKHGRERISNEFKVARNFFLDKKEPIINEEYIVTRSNILFNNF